MNSNNRILLIEDDPNLGYILSEYLVMKGFEVTWSKDGEAGMTALVRSLFHICLIDIMLPDTDGFAIAGLLTGSNPGLPFIFLTARGLKVDKLKGFRSGCDDYITKPVDEEELVARIKAVIKRYQAPARNPGNQALRFGNSSFFADRRKLVIQETAYTLTERETEVLLLLISSLNMVLGRDLALKKIWGSNDYFNRRSMDVVISRLRKRLEADGRLSIINVHGKGYILKET